MEKKFMDIPIVTDGRVQIIYYIAIVMTVVGIIYKIWPVFRNNLS